MHGDTATRFIRNVLGMNAEHDRAIHATSPCVAEKGLLHCQVVISNYLH